ncbi:MAG TPA: biosynthetic-type acetolactate synthase large subunit [Dehalococcoidia bacterium]|nr:biosynthetic-type acetolactate synthase large subunit [Dehalococcoidia bacterium]
MDQRLRGAQMVFEAFRREGVRIIFGYPGGAVLPLYDALPEFPDLHHVLVRHEQAAAHAADGYARATGQVGVCIATSGPGATNLVTGLATAMMDSSPVVAITGQVARPFIGRDAFQETDVVGVTLPVTKHNYLVQDIEELPEILKEAFAIAHGGRPGPVLVDIPKDVFLAEARFDYDAPVARPRSVHALPTDPELREAARLLARAERPVIVAGHGVILSRAYEELKALAEQVDAPVATTLLGLSCFPQSHPLNLGMPGMHGLATANLAIQEADLLIAVGMRMDDRVTGKTADFAPKAEVIHIDVDASEVNRNIACRYPLIGDVKDVLRVLLPKVKPASRPDWLAQIDAWRREYPSTTIRSTEALLPQAVIRGISEAGGGGATIVTDVGQHQMWTAQHCSFDRPNSHISSGGLGTMGFALPAAMGVQFGRPGEPVWVIAGDGGIQMNIQELATIVQENLPIKIAIINNGYLGMVRQWQQLFHGNRLVETPITGPDYVKLADAYGLLGLRVTRPDQLAAALQTAGDHPGPVLIEFVVAEAENVYPMIAPGTSNSQIIHDPETVGAEVARIGR